MMGVDRSDVNEVVNEADEATSTQTGLEVGVASIPAPPEVGAKAGAVSVSRSFASVRPMSGLPSTADNFGPRRHFAFGPRTDNSRMADRWDRARRTNREDGLKQAAGTYRASKQGVARRALNSSGSALLADPERVGLVEPDVSAGIRGVVTIFGDVADFRPNDDGLANPVHRPD